MHVVCSWCRLHNQKRIKALNIVIVEGLTQSDFYHHFLSLRRLRTNYTTVSVRERLRQTNWCCCVSQSWLVFFPLEGHLHSIVCSAGVWHLLQPSAPVWCTVCVAETQWEQSVAQRWGSPSSFSWHTFIDKKKMEIPHMFYHCGISKGLLILILFWG